MVGMSTRKQWFSNSTIEDILSVSVLEILGPISWHKVYRAWPNLGKVLSLSRSALMQAGITDHQAGAIVDRPKNVEAAMRLMNNRKIDVITLDDKEYPDLLRQIDDPPLWLFYRGDLGVLKDPLITIVGTRKSSAYAQSALDYTISQTTVENLILTSGLAYGVDKSVHKLALKYNRPTIAVLAGGLDSIYPADHSRLADEIVERGGLLLSEYPPLSRPRPAKFPIRNRILAGLSKVTVIVEAAIKSGSLTTAKSALDYNREIFAIPNEITRRNCDGTNFLIKNGATLLDSPRQIHEIYNLKSASVSQLVDKASNSLLDLIAKTPLSVDSLVQLTKLPIEEILGILTELEISDQVFQPEPGLYQRKKQ